MAFDDFASKDKLINTYRATGQDMHRYDQQIDPRDMR